LTEREIKFIIGKKSSKRNEGEVATRDNLSSLLGMWRFFGIMYWDEVLGGKNNENFSE